MRWHSRTRTRFGSIFNNFSSQYGAVVLTLYDLSYHCAIGYLYLGMLSSDPSDNASSSESIRPVYRLIPSLYRSSV
jgi:hypothetical protein